MTYEEFNRIREQGTIPSDLPHLLRALLIDHAGDWDAAHSIAQDDPSSDGSWVHAYLHRKEGNRWNANYWYNRAGKPMPDYALEQEWEEIAEALTSH
jgi:hypothetical protein